MTALQETVEALMIREFEVSWIIFSQILRLIANICSDKFVHDSWLALTHTIDCIRCLEWTHVIKIIRISYIP